MVTQSAFRSSNVCRYEDPVGGNIARMCRCRSRPRADIVLLLWSKVASEEQVGSHNASCSSTKRRGRERDSGLIWAQAYQAREVCKSRHGQISGIEVDVQRDWFNRSQGIIAMVHRAHTAPRRIVPLHSATFMQDFSIMHSILAFFQQGFSSYVHCIHHR